MLLYILLYTVTEASWSTLLHLCTVLVLYSSTNLTYRASDCTCHWRGPEREAKVAFQTFLHLTESFIYGELRQLWLCQHRFILGLVTNYQDHVSQYFLDESMTNL